MIRLAIVFAVLAVIAKLVFAGDGFSQGLLLAIGAAVFASGFTFFLLEQKGSTSYEELEYKMIIPRANSF